MEKLKNYINGKFVDSKATEFFDVKNPVTDETFAQVPKSTKEEVESAIQAAKAAFPKWRNTPGVQRIQPLFKLQSLLKEHIEELTDICTKDHGKERPASKGEVIRAYQMCEAAISVPQMQKGEYMSDIATGIDEYSILEPLGVFAMIPPFNFPVMIPFWFFPFALAAGDTYIIKCNEQTPMSMQFIFQLIDQCGFPPGVINFVHGGVEVANVLIDSPDVEGISSVGSTPIAKVIYRRASQNLKRAQCHGGANNFLVIDQTANLDKIMPNVMNSCFGNTGQRCLAGSVIMAVGPKDFYEKVKTAVIEASKKLKVGNGMDKDSFMGPVVSKKALQMLLDAVQKGLDEGGKLLLDGRDIKVPGGENGYFIGPCILEGLKPGHWLYDEEAFGPVLCLDVVENLDDAIEIINANPKGNAVTIYTESGENARHFRHEINCGQIGINIGVVAPIAWFPFAGAKDSFYGQNRAQGKEVIRFFTQERVVIERFHGSTKIEWD
jgi:malonate-semialdehyde dehydrogenase (acetylating) / methylmalonate-semialdehyde dehydrogenase